MRKFSKCLKIIVFGNIRRNIFAALPSFNMKMCIVKDYELSANRFIEIHCDDGVYTVIVSDQNESIYHEAELIGVRWVKFLTYIDEIDTRVKAGCVETFQEHIGGGWYVSLSPGYKCVNIRRWYKNGKGETKPTRHGIALLLPEWEKLKEVLRCIPVDVPQLTNYQVCFHLGQLEWLDCRECHPFGYEDL